MSAWLLAWRNLWRNPRRTAITLAMVAASVAILSLTHNLMDGLIQGAVANATNLVTGEVQAHAPGYLAERGFYDALADPEALAAAAEKAGARAAPRSYGVGLAALAQKSAGARFWGVDPAAERAAFTLPDHLLAGQYLDQQPAMAVVLGRKLARTLGAKVGDRIVVLVQAADGSLGNDLFTVRGILKTAGDDIDRSAAIIHTADFQRLFVSDGRVHQVAANSHGTLAPEALKAAMAAAAPGADLRTWRQLLPTVSDMLHLFDSFIWVFGLVFVLAAGLGVLNNMLMATFERMREFGIQKALGCGGARIMAEVAGEALLLCLLGSLAGMVLGGLGSWWFQAVGLDTSAWAGEYTLSGVAFDPVWRARLSAQGFWGPALMMSLAGLLAGLYPAWLAARLDPVRAINRV